MFIDKMNNNRHDDSMENNKKNLNRTEELILNENKFTSSD